ncbi:unnamed protein product [Linum tenue]|uniref:Uncharacterized protein n=1 Tax=Linum tenue TaxID=586396 RepID=A0AAV0K0L8_9ROSI|nr:unnamed protein product [Linum tenue]
MPSLKSSFDDAISAFSTVFVSVSPDLVIYDFFEPWAPRLAASLLHIQFVEFITTSAALCAMASHFYKFTHECESVEEIGVGVEVKRDGNGEPERGEIAKVIRELVMEGTGEVRRKAKEMSEVTWRKGDKEVGPVA